ncbi:hypothetical protein FQZ97_926680 [compost metagenome]
MILDDAVVHERDAARARGRCVGAGAVAEVGVRVVHGRCAVGGPAGVGDAGEAFDLVVAHLGQQFGHARGGARTAQAARMHRDAAGVIAAVFEPLKALDQDRNDVAMGGCADDAAHGMYLVLKNRRARW